MPDRGPLRTTRIRVRHYRALRDVDIKDLRPFTVLVGPGGFLRRPGGRGADDRRGLRRTMERIARRAGMAPDGVSRCVVNRVAVRELENRYFGDREAVCAAFPKVRSKAPAPYSATPDATAKKTSEVFERVLRQNGTRNSSKPDWAERMAPKMVPSRNRSASFRVFIEGVRRLVEQP